ncbi:MAG: hypothetical protein V3U76_10835 [Granulosicoccus sp.]
MASKKPMTMRVIAVLAVVFGLLTLKSGGAVLFVEGSGREAAGNYVPYVLWFNFVMGFVYITAGIGLWLQKPWSARLAVFIAGSTLIAFAVFGLHIYQGGLHEQRTVGAMVLRSVFWLVISLVSYKKMMRH